MNAWNKKGGLQEDRVIRFEDSSDRSYLRNQFPQMTMGRLAS